MTEAKRPLKGRIFISYRRIDTSYAAGRIYDRLVDRFGKDAIFMDVDTLEGGVDFVKVLEDAVQSCDVLIALIGRQWLSVKDKDGRRRLDSPEDFVRIEIAAALKRNIRVIPVLIDGVDMPQPTELPENLNALARRNALQVNHHSFNPDVYRLIEHTKSALDEAEELRVMKAQALQAAREKTARERAERETAEKAAQEKARLEAEEKARQKAAKEKEGRESAAKARYERNERWLARKATLAKTLLIFYTTLQSNLPKTKPIIRAVGIVGFMVVLFWLGSWGVPKLTSLLPTATTTVTFVPKTALFTLTSQPVIPPQTLKPTQVSETPTITITPTENYTSTAAPLPTEITDAKGVPMAFVPAGEFTMGADSGAIISYCDAYPYYSSCISDLEEEIGVHTVYLDSYYIDKYEVTNALYKDCVVAGVCEPPVWENSNARSDYYGNPIYANYPVIYVSWAMAKSYCEWRGAELPREAQWEKAARGIDARIYPWGNDVADCNKANQFGCVGDTAEVGSYEAGKSPYGIYDMSGNVEEWTVDSYYNEYYHEEFRVLRGTNWFSKRNDQLYFRSGHFPTSYMNFTGIRCAELVVP